MDIIYRKAEPKDSRKWFEFINMVWRDAYKDIFPEEVFLEKESSSKMDANEKKFLTKFMNNENMILYVAEYSNEIIGAMLGEIKSGYNFFHDEYADLVALYINPKYQGQKIGTTLKNIFEEWAKEGGATKYVIGVLKDNIRARKVYEKWNGKLSDYESDFIKFDVVCKEVFYTYNL